MARLTTISRTVAAIAVSVSTVCALAPAAGANTGQGFATPSHNIVCEFDKGSEQLTCTLFSVTTKDGGQATWILPNRGGVRHLVLEANIATENGTLSYGRVWQRQSIVCTSSTAMLECSNASGHGFDLSRQKQHVF